MDKVARTALAVQRSRAAFLRLRKTSEPGLRGLAPDEDGLVPLEEVWKLLQRLGSFKEMELRNIFETVGVVDGRVSIEDLFDWTQHETPLAHRVKAALMPGSDENPETILYSFCVPGSLEWDGKSFLKLCKDTGLITDTFNAVDADLIFARVLKKGQRRISLPQLQEALANVAAKKGVSREELLMDIADSEGPKLAGTKTMNLRLYEKPGPLVQRKGSTVSTSSGGPASARSTGPRILASAAQAVVASPSFKQDGTSSYQEVFQAFCGPRSGMDGKAFSKLCKDCGLLDRRFSAADADLIFAKVCPRGGRRIGMEQFEEAVWLIGRKRGMDYGCLLDSIANSAGPLLKTAQADLPSMSKSLSTRGGS
mmetsp:Transcript_68770/g.151480  ORF Transcript_68770/g.151480 Transcript_68770/m.151480 type:complete len:367 (-) Transcript_68770:64-1164(-)